MTKDILNAYIDACELVRETEERIEQLQSATTVHDVVKGSSPVFPYTSQTIHVEGVLENQHVIEREKMLLIKRKTAAYEKKLMVEEYINTCPERIQRIIKYRYIDMLSWNEVALKFGYSCSPDSIRKEFERFMQKQ